uniref:Uncharacterized protein n=1 Tax=Triticum urartu TaxID=4572 RepID=A0A8R7NYJ8_TRIUA
MSGASLSSSPFHTQLATLQTSDN